MSNSLIAIAVCLWFSMTTTGAPANRYIVKVEPVQVDVPVGNTPRLPYRLWVEYNDGYGEWRQVRWQNSSLVREQAEANATMNPVGTEYKVKGFVIGDNTTANGYPVMAEVKVTDHQWTTPATQPVARTLPLDKVTIDGDNRLTWNRDLDIDHLLTLDVRQQLYNYRDTYGLPTDGYPEADGWDSPTTKLKGHGSGHYMSALAMAFASCQDATKKDALRQNITLMVDELRRCQEHTFVWNEQLGRYWEARDFAPEDELQQMGGTWADFDHYKQQYRQYGYGYLNAIPAQHCVMIEKYSPYNNENGVWAPYYSVHKQLAGLIDIATYIDVPDVAQKALLVAKDMGLWVWNRMHYRTFVNADGRQDERRAHPGNRYEMWNMYIAGEVGGMAESLARLAGMTGTAEEKVRLLEAARCFDSPAFFDPLARNVDAIRTRHANQHIPMVTGALQIFCETGDAYYYNLAQNFWTMIQGRYRYAMGGVGNGEMFRQPYSQITSMATNASSWGRELHPEPTINETCCAYNLAKLTKDLNCFNPDDAAYMDYYERLLYNQLVGSLNPRQYQVLYQYAVGLNASKPWGNETPQSSCCGGTGAENHVKYQEAAYFVTTSNTHYPTPTLWVTLYMPTTATWDAQGVTIHQDCQWPAEHSTITFKPQTSNRTHHKFSVKLRVPYWATQGFDVKLNGKSILDAEHLTDNEKRTKVKPSSYIEIPARRWTAKDVIEVTMPFTKHLDFGPDKMDNAPAAQPGGKTEFIPMWTGTLMYGPLVMATTDISNWDEATVTMAADLSDVTLCGAKPGSGADAQLYTMQFQGRTFVPDYYADRNVTHYLRIDQGIPSSHHLSTITAHQEIDKSALRELLLVAKQRQEDQEAWESMTVKVPEYAPWARHGYARMVEQMKKSQHLLDSSDTQEVIDKAASALNVTINSMRPGNLPEPEDIGELTELLEKARKQPEGDTKLDRAIGYAQMVVKYVNDGSGTSDMIERATRQMKEVLNSGQ